jgi:hypothetical protein
MTYFDNYPIVYYGYCCNNTANCNSQTITTTTPAPTTTPAGSGAGFLGIVVDPNAT